jgi:hypothetical protein
MRNAKSFISRRMIVAVLATALMTSGSASAVVLSVDPGVVGGPSSEPLIDDQPLPAADRVVDVVFADNKYVEVTAFGYADYSGPPINLATFWLTDESGQEIAGTRTTSNVFSGSLRVFSSPVTAHDVHFEFDLFDPTDAVFDLIVNGTVGASNVPAPATIALLVLGLLGIGYRRRGRVY